MKLEFLFDPIEFKDIIFYKPFSFCKNIHFYSPGMDISGFDIALIGLTECRGEMDGKGIVYGADEVRKKLYHLKKCYGSNNIIDFGNLKNGETLQETYLILKTLLSYLRAMNITVILLGGSHDMSIGQHGGHLQSALYENKENNAEKMFTLLNIDSCLDIDFTHKEVPSQNYLESIFTTSSECLFHYIHLGYQSYFVNNDTLQTLNEFLYEILRLGTIRENFSEVEPYIRQADMVSFDISAISTLYAPGGQQSIIFGFTGEEACQLCWYAGLNDKLGSIGFYGYNVEKDDHLLTTATTVATMVWYFIEGFYHSKEKQESVFFQSKNYIKYSVFFENEPTSIHFYQGKKSERWWMEIPHSMLPSSYTRSVFIPCSEADYYLAMKGEIPDKWIRSIQKRN
ncbi:MAG: arginase family protein [Chitinophagaceae bacterium]|nr:arginase family protein [Chitinophagaceae bacterium]